MWILEFKGKTYTCPKGSLKPFAMMHAKDRKKAEETINYDFSAREYLEAQGFKISEVDDPILTEIPKIADWNNPAHRELYDKLFYHGDRKLTEEENDFCKQMYHMEEYACGLDG